MREIEERRLPHLQKLEKQVILYKPEFDQYLLNHYPEYRFERLSLDLDGILFRIQYMAQHHRDLDQLDVWKERFTELAQMLHHFFWKFLYDFINELTHVYRQTQWYYALTDVSAEDLSITATEVSFRMNVFSPSREYLEWLDQLIPDGKPFRMDPTGFFRYSTDSYNDAIAKAYPELFQNRHQDAVGTGADRDVFVHNFTFQTTEDCSLNCFGAGSMVLMADGTTKPIEEIQIGDKVLGVPEDIIRIDDNDAFYHRDQLQIATVTRCYQRIATYHTANWYDTDDFFYPTSDHPFLTPSRKWLPFLDIIHSKDPSDGFVFVSDDRDDVSSVHAHEIEVSNYVEEGPVYNLETDLHTFIVSNLIVHNCTYCYQFNKSPMRMDFETAKQFIDHLLKDEYGYINRHNSPAIILEFIGGEPLMEIDLTRKIYEYFLEQCYNMNHPWFTMHRLSICSNGLQYFDPEVQSFFQDYGKQISFNISIDGSKELHDACRIQPNHEGSYDISMAALRHFSHYYSAERNSKMTLAPNNLKYLYQSVVDFIESGMTVINLNCVFEEGWTKETAYLEYKELKRIADYLLLQNNFDHIYLSIFREQQEGPQSKYSDGNHCGGLGSMLAMRPNGQFYPCIRYMPSSVGSNVKDLCIGTVQDGMVGRMEDSEILKMMDRITRRSQSNDICFECPIGNSCAWCSALGHTVYGTPGKRTTFICLQSIAESLANVYYWNILNISHPEYRLGARHIMVPDEWATIVIPPEELNYLKELEVYSMMKSLQ